VAADILFLRSWDLSEAERHLALLSTQPQPSACSPLAGELQLYLPSERDHTAATQAGVRLHRSRADRCVEGKGSPSETTGGKSPVLFIPSLN